jgi:protein-tyrosine kinase
MSRVDEALRRAARTKDGVDQFGEAARVIDPSSLDRYEPEGRGLGQYSGARVVVPAEVRIGRMTTVAPTPPVEKAIQPFHVPAAQSSRLVVSDDVPPFVVEQYRRLAAILGDLQAQRGVRTLMVSSAASREGKTLTITNLALTLSESYQRRVLLIDADLRRPSVHEVLGLPNRCGLVDVVRNKTLTLPTVEVTPHLSVLTAGRTDGSLLAQLASETLRDAVARAATEFDWVLLDTPPVGLLPDAQLVARICEAVVFVIGVGIAPYEFVQRSIAALGPERIVGAVLNRIDPTQQTRGDCYSYEPLTSAS